MIEMATQQPPQPNGQELEKLLKEYQVLQEQLRSTALQLDQLQNQKIDMERARDELEKASGKVYFTVGGVIVETTREKALEDIKDRHALTDTRVQSASKQYNELKSRERQFNEKITQLYGQGQGVT